MDQGLRSTNIQTKLIHIYYHSRRLIKHYTNRNNQYVINLFLTYSVNVSDRFCLSERSG